MHGPFPLIYLLYTYFFYWIGFHRSLWLIGLFLETIYNILENAITLWMYKFTLCMFLYFTIFFSLGFFWQFFDYLLKVRDWPGCPSLKQSSPLWCPQLVHSKMVIPCTFSCMYSPTDLSWKSPFCVFSNWQFTKTKLKPKTNCNYVLYKLTNYRLHW